MSSLLYYSIVENLTANELNEIDIETRKNRKMISMFVKNLGYKGQAIFIVLNDFSTKGKRKIVTVGIAVGLSFAPIKSSDAIGLTMPYSSTSVETIQPSYESSYVVKSALLSSYRFDKIQFRKRVEQWNSVALQLCNRSITVDEMVLLRGGDGLFDIVAIFTFVIFINWYDSLFGVEAYIPNDFMPWHDPFEFWSGKYDPKNKQVAIRQSSQLSMMPSHDFNQMCLTMNEPKPASL